MIHSIKSHILSFDMVINVPKQENRSKNCVDLDWPNVSASPIIIPAAYRNSYIDLKKALAGSIEMCAVCYKRMDRLTTRREPGFTHCRTNTRIRKATLSSRMVSVDHMIICTIQGMMSMGFMMQRRRPENRSRK